MIPAIIYSILMWILGPKSKTYWLIAGIPSAALLLLFWPLGIAISIPSLILIPLIVPPIKALVKPKLDPLLSDIHTIAEDIRKRSKNNE